MVIEIRRVGVIGMQLNFMAILLFRRNFCAHSQSDSNKTDESTGSHPLIIQPHTLKIDGIGFEDDM